MFKLAVFNIQHLNSNREDFFAFIFYFLHETAGKIDQNFTRSHQQVLSQVPACTRIKS